MKIKLLTDYLETLAPIKFQETYDNCGLLIGNVEDEVVKALISLDVTMEVLEEAISNDCQLIISHHPLIFSGIKKINGKNETERIILKAIQSNIAIYAIHTNLDNIPLGVNKKIADKLGLINTSILEPKNIVLIGESQIGSGMIGELGEQQPIQEFLNFIKETFEVGCLKFTKPHKEFIKKVAVCGGSGSFLISKAKEQGADIFITSDIKYHQFFEAGNEIIIADIGHFESEQYTIDLLYDWISEKFLNFALLKSTIETNPVYYL